MKGQMNMQISVARLTAQNFVQVLRSMAPYGCGSIVRDYAQQSRKSLPRDSAPNKSLIDKVSAVNTYRSVYKRSTIFVKDLLHREEGTTVS